MSVYLSTGNVADYCFFPNRNGYSSFGVKCTSFCHICLTTSAEFKKPAYIVKLGASKGDWSRICKDTTNEPYADSYKMVDPGDGNDYHNYCIRWEEGGITVWKEGDKSPFMSFRDIEKLKFNWIGYATFDGSIGSWILNNKICGCQIPKPLPKQTLKWSVSKQGALPANPFVGGQDKGSNLYVCRVKFTIPGKIVKGKDRCFFGLGDEFEKEYSTKVYEVLCNFKGKWSKTNTSVIPQGAVVLGNDFEDQPLYTGRIRHDGNLTIGCVRPQYGLFVTLDKEYFYSQYEILVEDK